MSLRMNVINDTATVKKVSTFTSLYIISGISLIEALFTLLLGGQSLLYCERCGHNPLQKDPKHHGIL